VVWSADTQSGATASTSAVVVSAPAIDHTATLGVRPPAVVAPGDFAVAEAGLEAGPLPGAEETTGAVNPLLPQGADLQTPALAADGVDFAAGWQQVVVQTQAVADLLSLVGRGGPWTWVVGGALLVGAVEAGRLHRRRQQAQQAALAGWPEVIAPSGLA
jgi:hypothetical protein